VVKWLARKSDVDVSDKQGASVVRGGKSKICVKPFARRLRAEDKKYMFKRAMGLKGWAQSLLRF